MSDGGGVQDGFEAGRPAGYIELLRGNSSFRKLFSARVISLLGDWFNTLAILALLREVGGSDALAFGWVLILKTLPSVLMTPFSGVLVDRLNRKALLIGIDVLLAALVACLFTMQSEVAFGSSAQRVGLIYGIVFLMTSARAISEPARSAVLPDIVRREDLVTANAMSAAAWSLMFALGTALGGVVTAEFGWRVALCCDIGSYLLSAFLIIGLPIPAVPKARPGDRSRSFVDGLRYLADRPRIWTLAVVKMGWSTAGAITLVLTILGERFYSKTIAEAFPGVDDPALMGVTVLYFGRAIGTGLGPILSRRLAGANAVRAERLIGVGFFWGAACYLVLGQLTSLPLAVVCLVLAHLGGATVWVFSTIRLQASVPTEVRGRVFAVEQGGFTLTMATSTFLFSSAIDAEVAELSTIVSTLGAVMLLPGVLWALRGRILGWGPAPEPA